MGKIRPATPKKSSVILRRSFAFPSSDRALAIDILYGTIRNLFLLDGIIDELRRGNIKPDTRDLLRIGLYQIFLSEIAEHAAVNENRFPRPENTSADS